MTGCYPIETEESEVTKFQYSIYVYCVIYTGCYMNILPPDNQNYTYPTVILECLHNTYTYNTYIPLSLIVNGTPNPGCPITPQLPFTLTSSPTSPDNTEYYTGHRLMLESIFLVSHIFDYCFKVVEAVLLCRMNDH